MSFRELRSFTEVMRALGYPRLISMENFRLPNFELVADCLYWLVQRYYPGVDIQDDISTESERVKFLQSIAQIMLTKARMKLNIKKLYSADGLAVKELLKVASLLYKATSTATNVDEDPTEVVDFSNTLKGFNPKEIKQNAAEILKSGAALYEALGQEPELREYRARAVAGHIDTDFVQQSIQEAINQVEDHIHSLEQQLEDLERSEKTLDAKIEKKKGELERNEKRLTTLQSVRPAYMDEYERLQAELNVLYGSYLDRFRNLEFLENELEQYYQAEQEKLEAQERRLKKMQKRLAAEELRILRGEQEINEDALNGFDDDDEDDVLSDLSDDQDAPANSSGGGGLGGSKPQPMQRQGSIGRSGNGPVDQRGGSMSGGGRGGAPQVMGNMDFNDEDEASIDEDDNSDGGDVSNAGDRGPGGYQQEYGGGGGGYDQMGDEEEIPDDRNESDDDF